MLHRMQERGDVITMTLFMGAENVGRAESRNIIAELLGTEFPNEVVVIGGHIDSWYAAILKAWVLMSLMQGRWHWCCR